MSSIIDDCKHGMCTVFLRGQCPRDLIRRSEGGEEDVHNHLHFMAWKSTGALGGGPEGAEEQSA